MVLVEASQVVRAGISLIVSAQADMEIIVETSLPEQALEEVRNIRRKKGLVAVVGLGIMGERDGLWLIRSIRELFPTLPILACSPAADETLVSRALFMGADGYVYEDVAPEELADAIRRTGRGEVVLTGVSPASFGRIVERLEQEAHGGCILTAREVEVLRAAAEGLTARAIGGRLGIAERTVTTHLSRIYPKLGARTRIGAIAAATRAGILTPDARR